ncbi:MAG: HD domain-containing phosphohydrolase [Gammaproteobacteria bacterium]
MSLAVFDPIWLAQELISLGAALSGEKNHGRLLEMILDHAERFTGADGGTLYSMTDEGSLKFEILHNGTLDLRHGGTSGSEASFPPVPLYIDGVPNQRMVVAQAALERRTINVEDAYADEEYDFSGAREFDRRTGYRSHSILTVPMTNHEQEVIGVLQLLNKIDTASGEFVAFSPTDQQVLEALASMAAVSISNKLLIEGQRELFDSFIQLIAAAIDEKSPHTAGHCRRVPALTNLLADAVCATRQGPLAGFMMTEAERYELNVAAWLHDCGKITTPEHVIDKSTKLETIFDRVELIDARFEIAERDAALHALQERLRAHGLDDKPQSDEQFARQVESLRADRQFIRACNIGGESLQKGDSERIIAVAKQAFADSAGNRHPMLTADEVYNLQVSRGTLTHEEREIINNHMVATIKMLESLPYPRHLRRVPEFAGGHHERMDGRGFPRGLTREQMSLPARMMAIADIFEALTARDRPYKSPMPVSQALAILGRMKLDQHIDPDLFDVFVREQVYRKYAQEYLSPEQNDAVDVSLLPLDNY